MVQFPAQLSRATLATLQINVGKRCNQACHHCHVEAGPKRTEMMQRNVAERLMQLLADAPDVGTVDLTGGAPELNPQFRYLVTTARELGRAVIDRCNLTVLFEPDMDDLPAFLARRQVKIVASLPCYGMDNVDKQRGRGVFDKSIEGLRWLNRLGYGRPESGLELELVYNPVGAFLPPSQQSLEDDYRRELGAQFGVQFTRLLTIANLPIKRFADELVRLGRTRDYMQLLVDNYNAAAVPNVMCRSLISVGYDGALYDCDFNQMLELPAGGTPKTVWDIESLSELVGDPIATASHCFGCTAGAGSSCGGALT